MLNFSNKQISYRVKPVFFLLSLTPFLLLVFNAINDNLGTNPVEAMTHEMGDWTLRFLLITLAVTPLRKLLKLNWLIKIRRMLGLFAFFYATMHLLTYVWFDQYFDWMEILIDIPKRPFITIGFLAFVLLLPLALTSSNAMMRRLKKNWLRLHKLVYVVPILGVIHFFWLVKADLFEPSIYAFLLFLLLAFRVSFYQAKRKSVRV